MIHSIKEYFCECFKTITITKLITSIVVVICSIAAGYFCNDLLVFLSPVLFILFWISWFYLLGPFGKTPVKHLIKRFMHIIPAIAFLVLEIPDFQPRGGLQIGPGFNLLIGFIIFCIFFIYNRESYSILTDPGMLERDYYVPRIKFLQVMTTSWSLAIVEEIIFRYYFLYILYKYFGFGAIPLSAILFLLWHYLGKWGDAFSLEDYIVQLIFGLLTATLVVFSGGMLWGGILAHFLINSIQVHISIKKYRFNREKPVYSEE